MNLRSRTAMAWLCGTLAGTIAITLFAVARLRGTRPIDTARTAPSLSPHPRPDSAHVNAALARVFGDAVSRPQSQTDAETGDFNGDGALDLAAIVRAPAERRAVLEDELANWQLRDARRNPQAERSRPTLRLDANEPLLAIIHGFGEQGWQSGEARQAYLLRNAGKAALERKTVAALERDPRLAPLVPRLHGDVVRAGGSQQSLLYWTGAHYHALSLGDADP